MLSRRAALAAPLLAVAPHRARGDDEATLRDLLAPLLDRHGVPAASAALIRDGALAARAAVGAGPETLFQAASISKVVAAVVVLRLAEQGLVGLDEPVNGQLAGWRLTGERAARVTPRLLLAHRGATTVSGFPGYAVGATLPDLPQILDGAPPANTPAVRVDGLPGAAFRYSGGGTEVLQRLVLDAAGQPFAALAERLVLAPAGLARSSFRQPLPATERDAATAHDGEGRPLPGGGRVYPELAAAGLWSTASDLARLALAITASRRPGGLLQPTTTQLLATPFADGPSGAGLFVQPRPGQPPLLYHYGVNAGFRSALVFAADGRFGVALMTNGEGGRALIPAFLDALFARFGEAPFRPAF